MATNPSLVVVMYHYVRNPQTTPFPALKALTIERFRRQIDDCARTFEMASLSSALAFLHGDYRPSRSLCLLTFDDGLREHQTEVLPLLLERKLSGVFFLTTSCLDGHVAGVHKSHFLMAALGFERYRTAFLAELATVGAENVEVAADVADATYRFDIPDVARFKYLLNFQLPLAMRDRVLDRLFDTHLGDEKAFARELYLDWGGAREMQMRGMTIGGHCRTHVALATQDEARQRAELTDCLGTLLARLRPQPLWPLSYPYGSCSPLTALLTHDAGYACAFTTEPGANEAGRNRFMLRRDDTNDLFTSAVAPVATLSPA